MVKRLGAALGRTHFLTFQKYFCRKWRYATNDFALHTFWADIDPPTSGMLPITTPAVTVKQKGHRKRNILVFNTFPRRSLNLAFSPRHELTCPDRNKEAGLQHRIINSFLPAKLKHPRRWTICGDVERFHNTHFKECEQDSKAELKWQLGGESDLKAQSGMCFHINWVMNMQARINTQESVVNTKNYTL